MLYMCIEYHMYHVSAQGVDEHMINVHYYYYDVRTHPGFYARTCPGFYVRTCPGFCVRSHPGFYVRHILAST